MLIKNKFFFLARYVIIGILSVSLELSLRKLLISNNINYIVSSILPLFIGIGFAFILNIKLNFDIPRYYYKRSFVFFFVISISSFLLQSFISKFIFFEPLGYEINRFLYSGLVFLFAYYCHINFSFAKNKEIGIAVYIDNKENINALLSKVGFYPDYIHVDFVDKSMNDNANKPDFNKLNEIRNKWPNHRIESHVMSKNPMQYIKRLSEYSDVIYHHYEIDDNLDELKNLIYKYNVKPGIVLHASKKYKDLQNVIKKYNEILVLCIDKPGVSGQIFLETSYDLIKKINNLKNRVKFNLCVDGGLSHKNLSKFECEKIVSSSFVYNNKNPKKQIIKLKKILNN